VSVSTHFKEAIRKLKRFANAILLVIAGAVAGYVLQHPELISPYLTWELMASILSICTSGLLIYLIHSIGRDIEDVKTGIDELRIQIRGLVEIGIEQEENCPDNTSGREKERISTSGWGAFAGMIIGAALGLPFGPAGVVIGGLIGAAIGNQIEYEREKERLRREKEREKKLEEFLRALREEKRKRRRDSIDFQFKNPINT